MEYNNVEVLSKKELVSFTEMFNDFRMEKNSVYKVSKLGVFLVELWKKFVNHKGMESSHHTCVLYFEELWRFAVHGEAHIMESLQVFNNALNLISKQVETEEEALVELISETCDVCASSKANPNGFMIQLNKNP